jgi:class 3 adenylate cyclase/TolB-like protein/tetratricopeptide (TPR) repeat protein
MLDSSTTRTPASAAGARRLAAVYFADIVGYSALSSTNEPAALRQAAVLQRTGRAEVERHGGRVVKFVGDAVLAEFSSSEAAVRSALSLQASFGAPGASSDTAPRRLRVGVHVGEVTVAPDGDILGEAVNTAARLQADANPDQVLVSEDIWRQLRRVPVFVFTDVGERTLKGFAEPLGVYAVASAVDLDAATADDIVVSGAQVHANEEKRTRLIVLPFRILRADPETDFLAFSLPDAITCALSGLRSLIVRSNLAGLRYANGAPDVTAIARDAAVDVVLTGTLVRLADQIRVSAQLTDGRDGALMWSESLQVMLGDLLRLQDELTNRIVASLSLPLTLREHRMLQQSVPATPRAFEFFLRANELAQERTQWTRARDLYIDTLHEDPYFAPAWARLGRCYRVIGKYSQMKEDLTENFRRADSAFRRALELDPDLGLTHRLFAELEVELGHAQDAMLRFVRHARRGPADAEIFAGLVHACRYCGLLDVSLVAHQRAIALDPQTRTSAEYTYFELADWQRCYETSEHNELMRAYALHGLGRIAEARALLVQQRASKGSGDPYVRFGELLLAVIDGEHAVAVDVARKLVDVFPDAEGRFLVARSLGVIGEVDLGIAELRRIVDMGFFGWIRLAEIDPATRTLESHGDFAALLATARARRAEAAESFSRAGGPELLAAVNVGGQYIPA